MKGFRVQLWLYEPGAIGGATGRPLPRPVAWDASFALSDVGGLSLTYAAGAPGSDLIHLGAEIGLRVENPATGQLIDPPGSRFLVLRKKTDRTNPVAQTVWTCSSYGWLLGRVRQYVTTGLTDDGRRVFAGQDPRQVITTLVNEAKSRGGTADMTVTAAGSLPAIGFTAGVLPIGNEEIPPGQDALAVLSDISNRGSCEWTTMNRSFVVVQTLGADKSTAVRLRYGVDIDEAPDDATIEAIIGQVLVQGDDGAYLALTNPGVPFTPWGFLDGSVSAGGTKDFGTMNIFAQATLDVGAQPRVQMTRGIRFAGAAALPLVAYGVGDTISAPDDSGQLAALRVQQITLRFGADGMSGNLVLNDRFTERDLRQAAALKRLQNGATSSGGTGTTPTGNPGRTPKPVTSLIADSAGYTDASGTPKGQVSLSWVAPTQATDNTPFTPALYEIQARETTASDGSPRPGAIFAQVGLVNHPETRWDGSGYDAYSIWELRVRAVASSGNASLWTVISKQVGVDSSAPPVPSQPILDSNLGVLRITWNGLDSAGLPMPPRFDHIEVHVWYDPVFVPTMGDTYNSSQRNPGTYNVTGLPGGTYRYVRFVAVSRTGVKSAWTNPTVGQVINRVAGPDIQANSITTNEMIVGVLDGYLITGATLRTAAAGQRVQLDLNGISAYNSSGSRLTYINSATGKLSATGADISGTISAAVISGGQINGANIDGSQITGTTIIGGWIKTATSGSRIEMDFYGMRFYNAAGTNTINFSTSSGAATFTGTVTASNINSSTVNNPTVNNPTLNNSDLNGGTTVSNNSGNSWAGGGIQGASYQAGVANGVGIGVGGLGGADSVSTAIWRASNVDIGYISASSAANSIYFSTRNAKAYIALFGTNAIVGYYAQGAHKFFGDIEYDGALTSVSLRETKTKKRAIGDGEIDSLLQLDPITFKRRNGGPRRNAGVIAEQVLAAGNLHPLLAYDRNRELRGVAYSEVPMYLLALAKRQNREILALSIRIDTLEGAAA